MPATLAKCEVANVWVWALMTDSHFAHLDTSASQQHTLIRLRSAKTTSLAHIQFSKKCAMALYFQDLAATTSTALCRLQ